MLPYVAAPLGSVMGLASKSSRHDHDETAFENGSPDDQIKPPSRLPSRLLGASR